MPIWKVAQLQDTLININQDHFLANMVQLCLQKVIDCKFNEQEIAEYVKNQGLEKEYKVLHKQVAKMDQLSLWTDV